MQIIWCYLTGIGFRSIHLLRFLLLLFFSLLFFNECAFVRYWTTGGGGGGGEGVSVLFTRGSCLIDTAKELSSV